MIDSFWSFSIQVYMFHWSFSIIGVRMNWRKKWKIQLNGITFAPFRYSNVNGNADKRIYMIVYQRGIQNDCHNDLFAYIEDYENLATINVINKSFIWLMLIGKSWFKIMRFYKLTNCGIKENKVNRTNCNWITSCYPRCSCFPLTE